MNGIAITWDMVAEEFHKARRERLVVEGREHLALILLPPSHKWFYVDGGIESYKRRLADLMDETSWPAKDKRVA